MTTKCEADPRSIAFLEKMLDEEKPDLAVFTGDQVNGDTAPDAQTVCSLHQQYHNYKSAFC